MHTIPAETCRTEETIKRSRFIATVAHAPSEEDAKRFIARIQNEFPDATHHCWAFVAGTPGDTARIGMSDGGEPHGTAGKPILTVLLYSGIGEVVAVVTRFFGGTKLGTGGLVRAYSGAVKNTLEKLAVKEKREYLPLTILCDYSKVPFVKQMIASFDAEIMHEEYTADVSFQILIYQNEEGNFIQDLKDLTGGEVVIHRS
ncbi:MAG: YigZ family protein [Desulfovermiculus sp.]